MGGEVPAPMPGCRFNEGYATVAAGMLLELPPPASQGRDLQPVFAFACHQNDGYFHFQEHALGTNSGRDVVEKLRNAWPRAVRTVLDGRAVPGKEGPVPGTLVWILEDADLFLDLFVTSKVMVFTRPCTEQRRPCKGACGRPGRPHRFTIRSVQIWRPLRFLSYRDVTRYSNLGSEGSWRLFVTGDDPGLANRRFSIVSPEKRSARYRPRDAHRVRNVTVTICVDGELRQEKVPLNRGDDHDQFRADPVGFLRRHDVLYTHWTPIELKRSFVSRSDD